MPPTPRKRNTWKDLEPELKDLASRLGSNLIHRHARGAIEIQYYYCDTVMEFARFLRERTYARELGTQHHAFKILFKYRVFGEDGILEFSEDGKRVDIYLPDGPLEVEVKTLVDMSLEKLHRKAIAVIEAYPTPVDWLWLFFFYKVPYGATHDTACKYLLVFVALDVLGQDPLTLRSDLELVVEKGKKDVARKLGMRPTLILPLDNLIKTEDLEQEMREKTQEILEKDQALQEKEQEIQELREKTQEILEKDQALQEKEQEIQELR